MTKVGISMWQKFNYYAFESLTTGIGTILNMTISNVFKRKTKFQSGQNSEKLERRLVEIAKASRVVKDSILIYCAFQ